MASSTAPFDGSRYRSNIPGRRVLGRVFFIVGMLSIGFGLAALGALLIDVLRDGLPWLDWQFVSSFDSRNPEAAGILSALVGSIYIVFITIAAALPIGVATAIYLEEYAPRNWLTRFIEINIQNLAGVPSIIFGLLGLQIIARFLGLGRGVLTGGLTMALLVLPLVIVSSREAIRGVPPSLRQASLALGATRWQTVRHHVLPYAFSGILTGNIFAASTAIGETAPLIVIGALTYVPFLPRNPSDIFTAMPIQIYNWVSQPGDDYLGLSAAGILLLLAVLLVLNSTAIYLRQRLRNRYRE
jgi:phosphate transport system permease protein